MSFENFSLDLIYTLFIFPLAYSFQKHFTLKNRVTKAETELIELKKLPEKMDKLCSDVSFIKGQIEQHFKENSDGKK